ncbi:MAG: sigma-70 family RNA polymerase sigma factor [Ardenticatenia bacterium]|nr:sigma-70 family RNA polymerase sigma factor [Ardenticatenia bacterium]
MDVPIEGASPGDAITEDYLAWRTAILRGMRTRLDEADAEDVVQEIFLQARRDIGRYDAGRSALRTWLARLGNQISAKYYRSCERRLRAEANYAQAREHAIPLSPEERADIRQLLERLTKINHRIVAARFLLGESIEEIAVQNGLSEEAVRQRISRSLALLREMAGKERPR